MAGDEQDTAEAIDYDKIDDAAPGDMDRAPTDELRYPPDRPLGVKDPGADDRMTDSVASRQARTEPEAIEAIGHDGWSGDDGGSRQVGRLRAPGADDDAVFPLDKEKDLVAYEVGGGFRGGDTDPDGAGSSALSAEEAAMHLER